MFKKTPALSPHEDALLPRLHEHVMLCVVRERDLEVLSNDHLPRWAVPLLTPVWRAIGE